MESMTANMLHLNSIKSTVKAQYTVQEDLARWNPVVSQIHQLTLKVCQLVILVV